MWIFSQGSFLSIVEHQEDSNVLLVRARIEGDIERCWPDAAVFSTPGADYRFRAEISRKEVADKIRQMVCEIAYTNFKNNIADHRRSPWYLRVWEAMWEMQAEFSAKR